MKKISIVLICLIFTLLSSAQITSKFCISPGSLSTMFTNEEKDTLQQLQVKGFLNETDGEFIRQNLKAIEYLDLSSVTFKLDGINENMVPEDFIYNNKTIKTVLLPSKATRIGEYAFANCTSLERVIFPETLLEIGRLAFYNSVMLDSVILSEGLTTLGENAFYGCDAIRSIVLPNSVSSIGEWCFGWCLGLESIVLPESLKIIPDYAIYHCIKLKSINLPSTITTIGENALAWDTCLTSIELPQSLEDIGASAFYYCRALDSVIIPNQISTIKERTFYGCRDLQYLNIPNSVTAFEGYIVSSCTSLDTLFVPSSVVDIDDATFQGYDGYIKFDEDNPSLAYEGDLLLNKEKTKLIKCPTTKTGTCDIPASVKVIGDFAFYLCDTLDFINFPTSVTEISITGISYTSAQFQVDENNTRYSSLDGILYSKDQSKLIKCPMLKEGILNIPESVEILGERAFQSCYKLESIKIPTLTKSIDPTTFSNCSAGFIVAENNTKYSSIDFILYDKAQRILIKAPTKITEISTLPSTLETIDVGAFTNSHIISIALPEGVKNIGEQAFLNCLKLKNIVLPSTIEFLGDYSFGLLDSIETITCYRKVPLPIDYMIFIGSNISNTTLKVPFGSATNYSKSSYWNSFGKIEELNGAIASSKINMIGASQGSQKELTILSNTSWSLDLEDDWITLDVANGEGEKTITITALENPKNEKRSTYIYIKVEGNEDVAVKVTQYANKKVDVSTLSTANFGVFPNPVVDQFTITGIDEAVQVSIFDINGRLVLSQEINANEELSTQQLQSGMYFVKVQNKQLLEKFRMIKH